MTGSTGLLEALPRHETAHGALLADILDVLLITAVVPTTCVLIGLVGYMRNLYG